LLRKFGDRAIEGRRGEVSVNGNKWGGRLLIEKKGEGKGREDTRHRNPLTGKKPILFFSFLTGGS
jgi:hypothetical protein